jgi:Zn-dependent peptidase ImmA (M78 family)
MTSSSERRSEIVALSEWVAAEHCPGIGKVDPLLILQTKGITFSFNHYGQFFDGLLEFRRDRFHVFVNLSRVEARESPRARFTLGHELGHFFIDDHRNALVAGASPHPSHCDHESDNPAEIEADLFAAHLLLPGARFSQTVRGSKKGIPAILDTSSQFGTSVTSTALRYLEEEFMPCTLLKWNEDGLAWKRFSTSTYNAGFRTTISRLEQVPRGSATHLAMSGREAPGSGCFQVGSAASAWFPFVHPGDAKDALLIEQAVSLGRYGVLTILYPESLTYAPRRFA